MRLVSRPNFKGNEVFNNKNYGEYTVYVSGPATYAVPLFYEKTSFSYNKKASSNASLIKKVITSLITKKDV